MRYLLSKNLASKDIFLRIIQQVVGFDAQTEREHHRVYFEVDTSAYGGFIAGGCTDFSGAGLIGTNQLSTIFELVAFIHRLTIDRVRIIK